MRYTVEWTHIAENHLAAIWLTAPDQTAVTAASFRIDQELRTAPIQLGESRGSGVNRFAVIPPLAVWFEVIVDDYRVIVQAVSWAG
jgi:plasmid stabilization system protein ParE